MATKLSAGFLRNNEILAFMEPLMPIRDRLKLIADYIGWKSPILARCMELAPELKPVLKGNILEGIKSGVIDDKILKIVTGNEFDKLFELGLERDRLDSSLKKRINRIEQMDTTL